MAEHESHDDEHDDDDDKCRGGRGGGDDHGDSGGDLDGEAGARNENGGVFLGVVCDEWYVLLGRFP